ncbi:MAG: MIP family channel protein [Clostridia bacterium]|nr:MIP family channel protein [Clostridia bacterium]
MTLFKKLIAEFIGTLLLVLFGCGSAVAISSVSAFTDGGKFVFIAMAFGLGLMLLAYAFGDVSGTHVNPAVSLGMLIAGRMKVAEFFAYILAQFAGGIAGGALLLVFFGKETGLGTNGYGAASALNSSLLQALLIECILTFAFVLLILFVTDKPERSSIAGLIIGLSLVLIHIVGLPFTGTSVNPARSLGPAIFAGGTALSQVWVFLVAPLAGGALAALAYKLLKGKADKTAGSDK